jgi:hypothetical protein
MEKKPVTKDETATAIDALAARGKKPIVLVIRQELGGRGSFSTICKHVSAIAEEKLTDKPLSEVALPEKLAASFQVALQTLWQTATDIASADIAAIRKSYAQHMETHEKPLQDALEAIGQLETELTDCQTQLTKSEAENASLREQAIRLTTESAANGKNATRRLPHDSIRISSISAPHWHGLTEIRTIRNPPARRSASSQPGHIIHRPYPPEHPAGFFGPSETVTASRINHVT